MKILALLKDNINQLEAKLNSIAPFTFEEADIIEAYASRVARCSDILVHKVLKAVQQYDSEIPGSIRDLLQQSEKKGIITGADFFLELRAFRNEQAHDYLEKSLHQVLDNCNRFARLLLAEVDKSIAYCNQLVKQ